MRITFKQIEVFVAVAKMENMSRAAEVLYLSQSACSMALIAMENQLGGTLFDRHGKKLVLNERGRLLFPKAANVITEVKELEDLLLGKKQKELAGNLLVGASTTIGNYLMPKIIGNFVAAYPQVKVTLKIANTERIIKQVLKFDIDIGVIEGECHVEEIEVLSWKKDELIVIASPQDKIHKNKKNTRKDLEKMKWILREEGSGTREKFEEAMGGKINPFLELGHTEAIKQAVQAGLGLSCLSKTTVAEAIKSGQLVAVKMPFLNLTRNFYIILHKEKYRGLVLNKFLEEIKKQ